MISLTSCKKKTFKQKMKDLDAEIRETEKKVVEEDSIQTKQDLVLFNAENEELALAKAEDSLIRLKQHFYEQGEKPGKLISWQIKKFESERAINMIMNEQGVLPNDPIEINDAFVTFYKHLHIRRFHKPLNGK